MIKYKTVVSGDSVLRNFRKGTMDIDINEHSEAINLLEDILNANQLEGLDIAIRELKIYIYCNISSAEEKELLVTYRSLYPPSQTSARDMLNGLLKAQNDRFKAQNEQGLG